MLCHFPVLSSALFLARYISCIAVLLLLLIPTPSLAVDNLPTLSTLHSPENTAPRLPVLFRPNKGQWEKNVLFRVNTGPTAVSFMQNGVSFAVRTSAQTFDNSTDSRNYFVWNIRFDGSQDDIRPTGEQQQEVRTTFINSSTAGTPALAVPSFQSLRYANIYNNIDLLYYGSNGNLKYDYILRPESDIYDIRMVCSGINRLSVSSNGELQIRTAAGTVCEKKPYAYQNISNRQQQVDVRYEILNDSTFGFRIYGNYDPGYELTIDPVTLQWSTFIGGAGESATGYLLDIAIDPEGNIYGTGWYADGFPTTPGVYLGTAPDTEGGQAFYTYVFKLRHDGTSLEYATYIGRGAGYAIAVNPQGEAYFAVRTSSKNFPSIGYKGGGHTFIVRLSADGSKILYSASIGPTLLSTGGEILAKSNLDIDLALDKQNRAVIAATVFRASATTTIGTPKDEDILLCILNEDGTALSAHTLIGGQEEDHVGSLALTPRGEIVIAGWNTSGDFPTTPGVIQPEPRGEVDGIILKLDPSATTLLYSTYLGGSQGQGGYPFHAEYITGVAVDSSNNIYVCGYTTAIDFPTTDNAYDRTVRGRDAAFASKLSYDLSTALYSTYMGGHDNPGARFGEYASSIAVNNSGEAFIGGFTGIGDFPQTEDALPNPVDIEGWCNGFIIKLHSSGSSLLYSSLFGGRDNDYSFVCVLLYPTPCSTRVISCITSHSTDFPVTAGSYQPVKHNLINDQPVVFALADKVVLQAAFSYEVDCLTIRFNNMSQPADKQESFTYHWSFGDGHISTERNPVHTYEQPGTFSVVLTMTGCSSTSTVTLDVTTGTTTIQTVADTTICRGTSVLLTTTTRPGNYTWTPADGLDNPNSPSPVASPDTSTTYVVVYSNSTCTGIDTVVVTVRQLPVIDAGPDIEVCEGTIVQLHATGSGALFSWTPAESIHNPAIPDPSVRAATTATYTVHNTDIYGCTAKDSVTIFVRPMPHLTITTDSLIADPGSHVSLPITGSCPENLLLRSLLIRMTFNARLLQPLGVSTGTMDMSVQNTTCSVTISLENVQIGPVPSVFTALECLSLLTSTESTEIAMEVEIPDAECLPVDVHDGRFTNTWICHPGEGPGYDLHYLIRPYMEAIPMPADEQIELTIGGIQNRQVDVHLYDVYGRLLTTQNLSTTETTANCTLDTRHLGTGTYLLLVRTPDTMLSQTVYIVH